MFCSKCGNNVKEGENFCIHCGAKIVYPAGLRTNDLYEEEETISDDDADNYMTFEELDKAFKSNKLGNSVMTFKTRLLVVALYPAIAFVLSRILSVNLFFVFTIAVSIIAFKKVDDYMDAIYDMAYYTGLGDSFPKKRFILIAILLGCVAMYRTLLSSTAYAMQPEVKDTLITLFFYFKPLWHIIFAFVAFALTYPLAYWQFEKQKRLALEMALFVAYLVEFITPILFVALVIVGIIFFLGGVQDEVHKSEGRYDLVDRKHGGTRDY